MGSADGKKKKQEGKGWEKLKQNGEKANRCFLNKNYGIIITTQ